MRFERRYVRLLTLSTSQPHALAILGWQAVVGPAPDRPAEAEGVDHVAVHHHEHRLAVVGRTGPQLTDLLDGYLAGSRPAAAVAGDAVDWSARPIVHVFCGQGSQWPGMGLDLYRSQPVFAAALDECEELFAGAAGWSLLAELGREADSRLQDTGLAQPGGLGDAEVEHGSPTRPRP